jgi:hypothetical protein
VPRARAAGAPPTSAARQTRAASRPVVWCAMLRID